MEIVIFFNNTFLCLFKNLIRILFMEDSLLLENKLRNFVRDVSLDRFKQSSQKDTFAIEEFGDWQERHVLHHWLALILISGKELRITFKVHFGLNDCSQIAAPLFGLKVDEIKNSQTKDFIKEYCNLSAGLIKKILEDQQIDVGISLPLVTRGFDEIFFEKRPKTDVIHDGWVINENNIKIFCTSQIDIFNKDTLAKISYEISEEEEEIEFL